jgi:hypothetical protein
MAKRLAMVRVTRWVVQRMDVAGDGERESAHARTLQRLARQQRHGGMAFVQVFDDGQRLRQRGAIVLEHGHLRLGAQRTEFRRKLLAAGAQQMHRHVVEFQLLEVQGDAHAVSGRGTK